MKKYDYYGFLSSRYALPNSLKNFYFFKEMWIKYLDQDEKVPSDYRLMYLFIKSCPRLFSIWNQWKSCFKTERVPGHRKHDAKEWSRIANTKVDYGLH